MVGRFEKESGLTKLLSRIRDALASGVLVVTVLLAAGAAAEEFTVERALVVEIDGEGGVPWRSEEVEHPTALAVAADGRRAIADRRRNSVRVVAASGATIFEVRMAHPADADFLPDGRLLVTSLGLGAVREYDDKGRVVWEHKGLERPRDADRLANGNTLIAEAGAKRVIEVSPEGEVVWSYSEGLEVPIDAEVDADGNVIIADEARHRVVCVRRDGSVCWRLNHIGHPSSLAVLPDGTMLVAAMHSGMIVHFDSRPRILDAWRVGARIDEIGFSPAGNLLLALVPITEEAAAAPLSSRALAAVVRLADSRPEAAVEESGAPLTPAHAAGLGALVLGALLLLLALRAAGRRRLVAAGGALLVLAGSAFALIGSRPEAARDFTLERRDTAGNNLVFILFDSLRKDHMHWHGYWRHTAPALEAVAREGLVFDRFIAQSSWTKPSVASLFTSTYPTTHGAIRQTPDSQLPDSLDTLAEVLRAAGYYTIALMENPHMGDRNSPKGFDQGFEHYEYFDPAKRKDELPEILGTRALELLADRPRDRPFFLFVFFLNPHFPYEPRGDHFGGLRSGPSNPGPINRYDAEILDADRQVARILGFLREEELEDRTVFVFSTDHGEEFGDHGKSFHGHTLYDCLIDIPLIVRGLGAMGRFPGIVREIDLMPTLLDYLGVEVPAQTRAQMAGVSIRPFVESGAGSTGLEAISETRYRDDVDLISRRTENGKVIVDLVGDRVERYDLLRDRQEYDDIATEADRAEIAALRAWRESLPSADAPAVVPRELTETERERLRALGYLQDE